MYENPRIITTILHLTVITAVFVNGLARNVYKAMNACSYAHTHACAHTHTHTHTLIYNY